MSNELKSIEIKSSGHVVVTRLIDGSRWNISIDPHNDVLLNQQIDLSTEVLAEIAAIWSAIPPIIPPILTVGETLDTCLISVTNLFYQKIGEGFPFVDPDQNPQVFEYSDSSLKWLDRAALRSRKSIDETENKTFKMRVTDGHVFLSDVQLLNIASGFYDVGTDLDDINQDHKDALRNIADGAGTDDEKRAALLSYDINLGW